MTLANPSQWNVMGRTSRIVVVGAKGTGKTSILERAIYANPITNKQYAPTLEDTYVGIVETERGTREKLRFYDTGGLDARNRTLPHHYHAVADGYILVYSINDNISFQLLTDIKKDIDKNKEKKDVSNRSYLFLFLVGALLIQCDVKWLPWPSQTIPCHRVGCPPSLGQVLRRPKVSKCPLQSGDHTQIHLPRHWFVCDCRLTGRPRDLCGIVGFCQDGIGWFKSKSLQASSRFLHQDIPLNWIFRNVVSSFFIL
ncbi:uncharacterized protein LOC122245075 [Penaeus japonicus]|uniref:uncharacterized protein LOC122245075 n=1 Tax=Penaeus japonicus TaxID=27405 RepID=UPI001C70C511|nr:uncharacterized protein LOC122245075 [Penaeus japonicus]